MTANQLEALRLFGTYTRGMFDVWALAGSSNARNRAHVMTVWNGKKTPQSAAGVNAMRDAFYSVVNPAGDCIAARDREFLLAMYRLGMPLCRSAQADIGRIMASNQQETKQ